MTRFLIVVIITLIMSIIFMICLVYYKSDFAAIQREREKIRDNCYASAKARYAVYLSQNNRLNPDGSVGLSQREREYIEKIRKEEYRVCSELYSK